MYVFGDSLSDSGNNAVALAPNVTPVPIPGNAFIPTYPYPSGRYTNGEVWAQTLAFLLGLNADPSLLGGTDFAFGGAQTGPVGPISLSGATVPPSLETQVALFLAQHGDTAPSTALYIVAGGGEDVLHALTTIEGCGDHLGCINGVIRSTAVSFAEDIGTIVSALQLAGARQYSRLGRAGRRRRAGGPRSWRFGARNSDCIVDELGIDDHYRRGPGHEGVRRLWPPQRCDR
jgi:outer membrane lipase/esterase